MRTPLRALLGTSVLVALTGCAGAALSDRPDRDPMARTSATIVLDADQFQKAAGNLLNALRGRLTGMQVRTSADPCPEITLRGTRSVLGDNNPVIYVDGVRTSNTCVLDMLPAVEVQRVEVYPMGVAPRPPYKAHPNGLILVFLQDGRR